MSDERIRPFYCGSQAVDFEFSNCQNCRKCGNYTDETESEWVWRCDIQKALGEAFMRDGTVSAEIAARMNCTKVGVSGWCGELDPIEPIEECVKRSAPPPTRLVPLWERLRRTLVAAWTFWIPPWDRTDHDHYSGLRSPRLAWVVAWGIHRDDRERIR